ncbi:GntR family transcriptional regulator [Sporosarcina sp. ANT_H38]|uniref:GntR family transcriptional regulator n=2 Tax=Sporosarcina sp. ANT_H38 TaxID=2597358 RepID=UPI0011F2D908|nr:GntR family transcriptional regulator [Sporosarcina sp. ANT_H38]KAA0966226.1 GntR family transcriptional regulator [Sporosarcina sp. ANT_H38]
MENKMNKRQYAYKVIRTRIVDGTYAPGQRIIIDQIAKEVGSSHIPVREAIHQLESDQLIEFKPNIGAIVRGIDNNLYMETLHVLALLEGHATALSAPFITSDGLKKLDNINKEMKEMLESYELDKLGVLNRKFHFHIYSFCPNNLLIKNIQETWSRLDIVRHAGFTFYPKRTPQSIEEHSILIKLLKEHAASSEIEDYARKHKLLTLEAFKNRN